MEAINSNSNNVNEYIQKICKEYPFVTRPIRKEDYTLTKEEEKLIEKNGGIGCCPCCDSCYVSEIIGRPFTSCQICYCCAGDNSAMDSRDLCIFVNDKLTAFAVFSDKSSPVKYHDNK